jgi:hypothetical protein
MQNRSGFDALDKGRGDTRLPFIGLFSDGQMMYEVDRARARRSPLAVPCEGASRPDRRQGRGAGGDGPVTADDRSAGSHMVGMSTVSMR